MGVDGVPIGQSSKSMIGTITGAIGVRPFAVCEKQAGDLVTTGTALTFTFSNDDGGCGAAAGQFGLLDLDGSTSGGADDLKKWVKDGYPAPLPNLEAMLHESGGEYNALPMADLMDTTVVLPVYDYVTGSGKDTAYHGIGYITVQFCAWGSGAKSSPAAQGSCYDPASWEAAWNGFDGKGKGSAYFIQGRFQDYSPQAELNPECELGDETCDFGAHVVKLAD
jgi:hypothetical protein